VKKERRRELKRQRRAAQPAPAVQPITVPPEGVPIRWVEPTGRVFYRGSWRCEAGHHQTREVPDLQATGSSASTETEYRDPLTGDVWRSHRDLPIGAVYEHPKHDGDYHNWVSESGTKLKSRANRQDGRVLCCILPDGHSWTIDSRANNCTLPKDDKHWCWVRTGRPEDGTLDVGKDGLTCSAGAGSIQTGRWHGFLRRGRLVQS
jgi:hypothetical protein